MGGSEHKPKGKKSWERKNKQVPLDIIDQTRAGMPAKDSIREVVDHVSPQGVYYRIIKTTETDAYDPQKKRGS